MKGVFAMTLLLVVILSSCAPPKRVCVKYPTQSEALKNARDKKKWYKEVNRVPENESINVRH